MIFIKKTLEKILTTIVLTGALALGAEAKSIRYSSGYGFPDYKLGPITKQNNWQSNDSLDKIGWEIIKKRLYNLLCFEPNSDFKTFSPKDNYATFRLHTDKPIKSFHIGGEYHIEKNGFIDIFVSGDNENWFKIQHFDSRGRESYRIGWGHSACYPSQLGIKLNEDLYVKHCVGAKSNKDYIVEIWRFSASVITFD